jgi:ABC-type antimicrobial peptide transport system permease subunit
MLRSLGWKKKYLVAVITLKSISFSFFGLFVGILVAFIVNTFLREIIYIEALNYLDYNLTTASIVTGIAFGFFTPLFANYWPIKESLSRDLR